MKFLIVLSALVAVGLAKPGFLASPLVYSSPLVKLSPGAPIGLDGRVVDTPEVNYAKAEHAAAHINEKINLANEAVKSADYIAYAAAPVAAAAPIVASTYTAAAPIAAAPIVASTYAAAAPIAAAPIAAVAPAVQLTKYTGGGAPIGLDGRVVDTPEVAYAKAEHAAAHFNEKVEQGQELLRNSLYSSPLLVSSYAAPAYATQYIQHYY